MVIFANGNKYEVAGLDQVKWNDGWKHYYVTGKKWIKSKQRFSSNSLIHSIGTYYEVVESLND